MSAEIVYLPISLRDLSHELRTPLTAILGTVYQLDEEALSNQQKGYIADIKNAGMNLLKLADALLDAKRLSITNDNVQKIIDQSLIQS